MRDKQNQTENSQIEALHSTERWGDGGGGAKSGQWNELPILPKRPANLHLSHWKGQRTVDHGVVHLMARHSVPQQQKTTHTRHG